MPTPPPRNKSLIRLKIKGSWRIQSSLNKALFLGKELALGWYPSGIYMSASPGQIFLRCLGKKSESYMFLSCLNLNDICSYVSYNSKCFDDFLGTKFLTKSPCFPMFPHVSYNSKYSYRNHHVHLCDFPSEIPSPPFQPVVPQPSWRVAPEHSYPLRIHGTGMDIYVPGSGSPPLKSGTSVLPIGRDN